MKEASRVTAAAWIKSAATTVIALSGPHEGARIEGKILKPLANKPGAKIDTLKKLRILIRHA